jgi:hypothetical protein
MALGIWSFGRLVIWLFGYLVIWLFGYLVIWLLIGQLNQSQINQSIQ